MSDQPLPGSLAELQGEEQRQPIPDENIQINPEVTVFDLRKIAW